MSYEKTGRTRMGKVLVAVIAAMMTLAMTFALVGCGGGSAPSSSASSSSSSSASSSSKAKSSNSLDKYSWEELSRISDEIAAAPNETSAIEIAKSYGLTTANGKLDGKQSKTVVLANGKTTAVQVAGIAHDTKTGGGKAGITFIFRDGVSEHPMNSKDTNKGGWEKSEMRTYLNSDVLAQLPDDLKQVIVAVDKKTNNAGKTKSDASVSTTSDKLWLVSAVEMYGQNVGIDKASKVNPQIGRNIATVFNAEGKQYQIFEDIEQAGDRYQSDFLRKCEKSYWWLRSPAPQTDDDFELQSGGSPMEGGAEASWGVVPFFCI